MLSIWLPKITQNLVISKAQSYNSEAHIISTLLGLSSRNN